MHFSEIRFKDFRGFVDETLVLGDRMTVVLAGPNGCGKSSVLAAAGSLASAAANILADHYSPLFLGGDERNIRQGCVFGTWSGELVNDSEMVNVSLGAGPWFEDPEDDVRPRFGFLSDWADILSLPLLSTGALPLLTYLHGGSTRTQIRQPEAPPTMTGRLAAYHGAFDQEAAHFNDFETWYEAEENIENEAKIRKGDLKYQHPPLRAVRTALRTFLTELRGTALGRIEVVRTHVDGPLGGVKGRLTVAKGDDRLFLDQLSDGERRLIVLVGDVARRMAILNPHLDRPTDSPGILLADEIDLHLHPGWQRRVMPALRATFPNVQLIVTTHSPQVLASVDSEAVVLMKDFKFLPGHPKTRGRDSNTLLNTVFEVPERPEEVQAELRELYEALEDHPRRARGLFKKLRARLEEDDPELARIETLLAIAGG